MRSNQPSLAATTNTDIYTGAQCQQLDQLAASALNIPTLQLMERAGAALLAELSARYPQANRLLICCGTGNNAGDGYVLARLALEQGWLVQALQVDGRKLTGDAGFMQQQAHQAGLAPQPWTEAQTQLPKITPTTLLVDALLGTSVVTEPRPTTRSLMQQINAARSAALALVAVDIPSGVNPQRTGLLSPDAIRADFTLTFLARKLCLVSGAGVAHVGALALATLGAPSQIYRDLPGLPWLQFDPQRLPQRLANTYKHQQGQVVVVGGDHGMGGAVTMAAEAALRVGAGLVSLITRAEHVAPILARRPELMVIDAQDVAQRRRAIAQATLVVVGPGLGRAAWGRLLFADVIAGADRILVDADGISLLAEHCEVADAAGEAAFAAGERIITPHAGEGARLLGISSAEVESDRQSAVQALASRAQAVALLKGPGTLVANPVSVCGHGNPAMATAGMGDVLAGVIGGLWAQGLDARLAAELGACWHGAAADHLALGDSDTAGQRSLLATQVMESLDKLAVSAVRTQDDAG